MGNVLKNEQEFMRPEGKARAKGGVKRECQGADPHCSPSTREA